MMKDPRTLVIILVACASAHGEVAFDWVTVGNSGNLEDSLNAGDVPGIGAVNYTYRISRYPVTNDQYAEFLNAVAATDSNGLYGPNMANAQQGGITQSGSSGSFTYAVKPNMGSKPAIWMSYIDAMRFVNWLHNGQPTGAQDASTTEDGVYAIGSGLSETRAVDAQFFIPSENEWYKAAYHQPAVAGGDGDDYWLYPTGTNTVPTVATANATGDISNPGANVANYNSGAVWGGPQSNVTTVGSAGSTSDSYYGTSDQGGNVWEWNEAVISGFPFSGRCIRGGDWDSFGDADLRSSTRVLAVPTGDLNAGFRIASPVPSQQNNVPAVSEWALLILTVGIAVAGTVVLQRRWQMA